MKRAAPTRNSFRIEGMFDRMDAVGKAILGITTQCAQCHTHKYDPISHHEYYQMFAAMNDFHEACVSVYTPDQSSRRDDILTAITGIENQIRHDTPDWNSQGRRVSRVGSRSDPRMDRDETDHGTV